MRRRQLERTGSCAPTQTCSCTCDCSPTAIDALRASPEHDSRRLNAFVADLADGEGPLVGKIDDASVDAVTGVFFFSALDPPAFGRVARSARGCFDRAARCSSETTPWTT